MALSTQTLTYLTTALADAKAGAELALAVQNQSKLSAYTMIRLVDAMGSQQIANDIQAAILGTRPLTATDLQYMNSGFTNTSVTADVATHAAAGVAPGTPSGIIPGPLPIATVAAPTFLPAPGTYASPQTVTISSTIPGATFYYTTNGSTPTTSSTLYTGPVSVSMGETLKALGVKTGFKNSTVTSGAYTIDGAVATATFSPVAGAYGPAQSVTVSSTTAGATFHYTTDGSTPTTSSTLYTGPISVAASETIKVLGTKALFLNSAIASAAYTIDGAVATATFSPVAGAYGPAQSVTVSSTTAGATFYYTTDGSTPTTGSTLYSGPISVSSTETLKVLGTKAGFTNSAIATAEYTISA